MLVDVTILVRDARGRPVPGLCLDLRSTGQRPCVNGRREDTLTSDSRGRIALRAPASCRLEAVLFERVHELVVGDHSRQWFEIRSN